MKGYGSTGWEEEMSSWLIQNFLNFFVRPAHRNSIREILYGKEWHSPFEDKEGVIGILHPDKIPGLIEDEEDYEDAIRDPIEFLTWYFSNVECETSIKCSRTMKPIIDREKDIWSNATKYRDLRDSVFYDSWGITDMEVVIERMVEEYVRDENRIELYTWAFEETYSAWLDEHICDNEGNCVRTNEDVLSVGRTPYNEKIFFSLKHSPETICSTEPINVMEDDDHLIGKLEDEIERLELTTPVSTYLEEYFNNPENFADYIFEMLSRCINLEEVDRDRWEVYDFYQYDEISDYDIEKWEDKYGKVKGNPQDVLYMESILTVEKKEVD